MRIGRSITKQSGLSRSGAVWLLVFLGVAGAGTYLFFPSRNPSAPILLSPPDGTKFVRQEPSTPVQLRWEQGGDSTQMSRQPRQASHFIICLSRETPGPDCGGTGSGTPIVRLNLNASDITRREEGASGLIGFIRSAIAPKFKYALDVDIPAASLPANVNWTIGACSGPGISSCTFAKTGRTFEVTDINLVADDLNDVGIGSGSNYQLSITLEMHNTGSQDASDFTVFTRAFEIRHDNSQNAILDPADPAVVSSDNALLTDGRVVPIGSATSGQIVGIIPVGAASHQWSKDYSGLPANTQVIVSPCSPEPCTIPIPSTAASGDLVLFALLSRVDEHDEVMETNENDNLEDKNNLKMFVP